MIYIIALVVDSLVPRGGIEPPRDYSRRILSPLRLPISPPRHSDIIEDLPIRV